MDVVAKRTTNSTVQTSLGRDMMTTAGPLVDSGPAWIEITRVKPEASNTLVFFWVSCVTSHSKPAHRWPPSLWVLTTVQARVRRGHTSQDLLSCWLLANENTVFVELSLKCWWSSGRIFALVNTAESSCFPCCNRKWRHLKNHCASWKAQRKAQRSRGLVKFQNVNRKIKSSNPPWDGRKEEPTAREDQTARGKT